MAANDTACGRNAAAPRGSAGPVLLAAVALLGGCATDAAKREQATLRAQLEALRKERTAQAAAIDDLSNRLLLLEDRQDSQRVTAERQGAVPNLLPVVELRPGELRGGAEAHGVHHAEQPSDEPTVVYEGEAAESVPPALRPSLKLAERPRRPRTILASTTSLSEGLPGATSGPGERIPVVPLPPPPSRGGGGGQGQGPTATGGPLSGLSPAAAYRLAYDHVQRGEYVEALTAFDQFLKQWPRHDYADNALYWSGECDYARRDYAEALRHFRGVLDTYPNGNKVPDALLKAGYALEKLGQGEQARDVYQQLVRTYPRHEVAPMARQRLEEVTTHTAAPAANAPGSSATAAAPAKRDGEAP
jgi:tol-pal system protein YbgF